MGSTPVGISASRGAGILGLSEFTTPLEVWQLICEEREPGFNAKRGYTLPAFKDSAPLRWGKAFEDAIVTLAEEREGRPIIDRERAYLSDGRARLVAPPSDSKFFMSCHVDGNFIGVPGHLDHHEGKTTSPFPFREKWGEDGTDRVPRSYQVQAQHEFVCTGAEREILSLLVFPETQDHFEGLGWQVVESFKGTVAGLSSKEFMLTRRPPEGSAANHSELVSPLTWARVFRDIGQFHTYYLEPNAEAGRMLIDAYRHFWDHHVLTGIEPEPRTYEDVKRLFPEPKATLVCPPLIAGWFAEMKAIGEEIGEGGTMAKRKKRLAQITLDWARKQDGTMDEESRTATIFRDETGKKLGQFARQKNGVLVFRAS